MSPKIKNIILFLGIAIALILIYVFFFAKKPDQPNLVSSGSMTSLPNTSATGQTTSPSDVDNNETLSVLLNVQSIVLDDALFKNPSWVTLKDNGIILNPDTNPGRINPFAPIGSDITTPAPIVPNNNLGGTGTLNNGGTGTPDATNGAVDANALKNTSGGGKQTPTN